VSGENAPTLARLHPDGGEIELYRAKSHSGAPRPMKMGTIISPWRYDVTHSCASASQKPRPCAILSSARMLLRSVTDGPECMAKLHSIVVFN